MRGRGARAIARRAQAVNLYTQGCTFDEIARKVGYANRGTAHRVVTRAYEERIVADIDVHRAIEGERLDAATTAMFEVMEDKNANVSERLRAAHALVQISKARIELLGLAYQPSVEECLATMWMRPELSNPGKATSECACGRS